jgi:hypothetical protein
MLGSRFKRTSNGLEAVRRRRLSLTDSGRERSSGSCDEIDSAGGDDDEGCVGRVINRLEER